ncbi:MAG: zf-HC2 domain-containing protein [bacterium]
MKCQLQNRSQLIADYLTGELSEKEGFAFEAHYFECSECFQELKLAEAAVMVIEKDGPEILAITSSPFTKFLRALREHSTGIASFKLNAGRLATVLVLIVFLIALPASYLWYIQRTPNIDMFSENFEKSLSLENLMNQTIRSNQFISDVHPQNDQRFEGKIAFRWKLQEDYAEQAGTIELRILNNKAKVLFRYKTQENHLEFNEKLTPGLYYWALLNESEMMHLGRFNFVKQ